jgi:hypothetical protein
MKLKAKLSITEEALRQRINRKLKKDQDQVLKRTRSGSNTEITLGDYYVVDIKGNYVVDHHIQIEKLGRKLGVLAESEKLQ